MKPNKECVICGEAYHYCSSCPRKDPTWKQSFCCENCRKIYYAVAGYTTNQKTKQQAAEILLNECDLSNMDHFKASTKYQIMNILEGEKKVKPAPEKRESAAPEKK